MNNHDLDPRNDELYKKHPKLLNRDVYYRGKDIIQQGEDGYRAYYIEQGRVEVLVEDGEHELKVAELGPGDIFGEMALINNEPRTATVRALDDVTVTVISRDEIEGKINRIEDKAIRALIDVLAKRLRRSTLDQLHHYRSLSEFQDRVTGIVDKAHDGIDSKKRDAFRRDVEPLLKDLQSVLDRYQK